MSTNTATVVVPQSVLDSLLAAAVAGAAGFVLSTLKHNGTTGQPRLVHPGDGFGRIMAWLWSQDRDRAMLLLADYLGELRQHQYLAAQITPPITLTEVLEGLPLAWPSTPSAEKDCAELADYARVQVPRYHATTP